MKRKIITTMLSLMLCFTSAFVLGACKKEPVPVAEAAAMESFNTAMTNMNNEKAIKMTYSMLGYKTTMIASEDQTYIYIPDTVESWSVKNGEVYDLYTIVEGTTAVSEDQYIKSISPAVEVDDDATSFEDMFDETMFEDFDLSELKFANASELDGELTIKFDIALDLEDSVQYVFKIKDNKITSMSMKVSEISITLNFSYGENLLDEIPAIPTVDANNQPIDWIEYEPSIEVEGIPETFEVGDTLDLEDVELYFYENVGDLFPLEDFDVTMDMISGFSTEEAGTFTMTITFCGLTCEIEYTVTDPAVAE